MSKEKCKAKIDEAMRLLAEAGNLADGLSLDEQEEVGDYLESSIRQVSADHTKAQEPHNADAEPSHVRLDLNFAGVVRVIVDYDCDLLERLFTFYTLARGCGLWPRFEVVSDQAKVIEDKRHRLVAVGACAWPKGRAAEEWDSKTIEEREGFSLESFGSDYLKHARSDQGLQAGFNQAGSFVKTERRYFGRFLHWQIREDLVRLLWLAYRHLLYGAKATHKDMGGLRESVAWGFYSDSSRDEDELRSLYWRHEKLRPVWKRIQKLSNRYPLLDEVSKRIAAEFPEIIVPPHLLETRLDHEATKAEREPRFLCLRHAAIDTLSDYRGDTPYRTLYEWLRRGKALADEFAPRLASKEVQ